MSEGWRRERDSNPRNPFRFSGFQDHRHRPLGHLSALNKIAQSSILHALATIECFCRALPHFALLSPAVVTCVVTAIHDHCGATVSLSISHGQTLGGPSERSIETTPAPF